MAIAFGWANQQNNVFLAANTTTNVGSTNAATTNGAFTVGDVLVTTLMFTAAPGTITPPAGWTQIGTTQTDSNAIVYTWWSKIAGASETGSYTFSWVNSVFFSWALLDYTGSPTIDVSGVGTASSGGVTTLTANSISPTGSTDILITVFAMHETGTITALPGNVRFNGQQNSSADLVAEIDQQLSASGATGNVTCTGPGTFRQYAYLMLALAQPAGGPTVTLHPQIWM